MNRMPVLRAIVPAVALLFFARSGAALEILQESIEQTYAVDASATLSIRNRDGSIAVYAGDSAKIAIRAVKKAYASDRLKSIVVEVRATPKGVAIETILPPEKSLLSQEDRSGTVEYTIIVPQTTRITQLDLDLGEVLIEGLHGGSATAHVVNGWLVARNCFGDLDLILGNGRLQVAYDWWEDTKFSVKLSSPEGDIRASIPSDASASIIARTTTGRIANQLAIKKEKESGPVRALNFAIGPDPKTAFEMNSISGDIKIEKNY